MEIKNLPRMNTDATDQGIGKRYSLGFIEMVGFRIASGYTNSSLRDERLLIRFARPRLKAWAMARDSRANR